MRVDRSVHTRSPGTVTAAVWLTVLSALLGLLAAAFVATRARSNADEFLMNHPDSSRTIGLVGSYVAVAILSAISVLLLIACRSLRSGRRWSWVTLVVISGAGVMFGLVRARSALQVLGNLPNLLLLACLMAPATRTFVQRPLDQGSIP
jgi:hypothetical protein